MDKGFDDVVVSTRVRLARNIKICLSRKGLADRKKYIPCL